MMPEVRGGHRTNRDGRVTLRQRTALGSALASPSSPLTSTAITKTREGTP